MDASFQPSPTHPLGVQPAGTPVSLSTEQLSLFQESTPLHAFITQVLGVALTIDRERSQLLLRGRPDDVSKAINSVHQAVASQTPTLNKPTPPPHPLALQPQNFHQAGPPSYPSGPPMAFQPHPHLHAQPQPHHMQAGYSFPPFGGFHPGYPPHPQPVESYATQGPQMAEYGGPRGDLPRYEEPVGEGGENGTSVSFQMWEKDTARLIGRRGVHLHQLQDETGARIQVDSNVPPGAPRTVYVWGSVAAVDNALVKIYNKMRRSAEPFLPVPKPSFAEAGRRETSVHPLEVEHEWPVEIPANKRPFLSNEVLKEIEQNSGASIVFVEDSGEPGEPQLLKLLVKGQALPIHYAVAALFDQVDGDLKEPTQVEDETEYVHLDAWLKEPLPHNLS